MIKILAVSDEPYDYLVNTLQANIDYFRREIDLVISCGDLPPRYVELLASVTNKMVYYVEGNHFAFSPERKERDNAFITGFAYEDRAEKYPVIPGGINIHRRYIVSDTFRLIGFEGSQWYNGEGKQYEEKEMARFTAFMRQRLSFTNIKNAFSKDRALPLIVVTHAPIAGLGDGKDRAHRGFKAFRAFALRTNPALWLYGHVHLNHFSNVALYRYHNAIAVNCYGFKFISLEDNGAVRVSFNHRELWGESE